LESSVNVILTDGQFIYVGSEQGFLRKYTIE